MENSDFRQHSEDLILTNEALASTRGIFIRSKDGRWDAYVLEDQKGIMPDSSLNSSSELNNGNVLIHLTYDLKNSLEELRSRHPDHIGFRETGFLKAIPAHFDPLMLDRTSDSKQHPLILHSRTSKERYAKMADDLLTHIHRGDIYEVNYCIEFFAEKAEIDPVHTFLRLHEMTNAPHGCLYRNGHSWLLCASPERYLLKKGNRLISQPIKGTRKRGETNEEDERLKSELLHDPKERSENIMIVDLVRNDLSKVAERGSVHVDELCGIYTFPTVHQMISTVSADVRKDVSFEEIIRASFPMGSMTGAPKFRAMQLIDQHEDMRRGIYSGSVGLLSPDGNFDLNVVIRSVEYNENTGYLSVKVGSALTANCNPEKEYEECLLKAEPMLKALNAVIV